MHYFITDHAGRTVFGLAGHSEKVYEMHNGT